MSIYEKVKSLFCAPTDNCCEKLCSHCKGQSKSSPNKGSDENFEEPPSKLKILIEKIQSATPQRKPSAGRRQTGWDPKIKPEIDEDEDDDDEDDDDDANEDDDEPPPDIWKSKKSVVFPLSVTSTGPYMKRTDSKDPVKSRWANKDTTVYSTVTFPGERASRYMIESNLQYFVLLPANTARRPSRQKKTRKSSLLEESAKIEEISELPKEGKTRKSSLLEESAKIEEISELPKEGRVSNVPRKGKVIEESEYERIRKLRHPDSKEVKDSGEKGIGNETKPSDVPKEEKSLSDVTRKRNVIEESELDQIKKFRTSDSKGGKDSGESGSGNEIELTDVPQEEKSLDISKEGRVSDVTRKRNVIEESELDKIKTFRTSDSKGGKDSGEIKLSDVPKEEKSSDVSKEDRMSDVDGEIIELDKIKKHKDSSDSKGGENKYESGDESDIESDIESESESESESDDSSIRSSLDNKKKKVGKK